VVKGGKDMYWIYEYIYKISRGLSMCFYARDDKTVEEMVRLYQEGTSDIKGLFCKFKKKRKVYIDEPPYEFEQSQIEILKKGIERKNALAKENSH
jgi:hypothetical protein